MIKKGKYKMKIQIRRNVFETNSSSVHSLTMCNSSDYEKWKNGELAFDRWNDELVPITDEIEEEMKNEKYPQYLSYEQFYDYEYIEFKTYCNTFTTQSGDTVVAFGYYGHD